jgi:hypothetical protein
VQLSSPEPVRGRLRAAVCVLLASGVPAVARADGVTQVDSAILLYGERSRADVVEPTVRVTRTLANGQAFSAQFGYDVITGASPTGAVPSGQVQTTTSASGTQTTVAAGAVPVTEFRDRRYAFDADWRRPLAGTLASTLAGHYSREKDYESVGGSLKLALEADQRLFTITAGVGYDHDGVFPVGGTPLGLTDGSGAKDPARQPKQVVSGLVGIARVISRRWLVSLTGTHAAESGYLTEPYKVVSEIDTTAGEAVGHLTELRPDSRRRNDVLATSVSSFGGDVLHLSYRYYWDDWDLASHTVDFKYRHDVGARTWLQPHLRYYTQSPANFYTTGLVAGAPLPAYATSDYRLGPLRTMTAGATLGFQVAGAPGEWSVRTEYIRQTLAGPHEEGGEEPHPGDDDARTGPAAQAATSAFALRVPALDILSLVVAYSLRF